MSKEELISGYANGSVSRRNFIRGMVALGVTLASANSYAGALAAPGGTPGPGGGNEYPSGSPPGSTPPGGGHGRGPTNPAGDPPGSNPPGGGHGRGGDTPR